VHLRSLTLKGFKSFPDRTKLEFSPGVSVIVGPNGSGKSNVTDAVLWAMGEQSPLAVRGQSMQDVIFAGGAGVQGRSEAEVEVVLDNDGEVVDLPAGEIAISRRLNRAGEGEYRVNGARCRLSDVIEILSDTGLGKEMHSVVSQGRVEAIVTSRPRDRRMLIEEAAGLGKHRKRRRRAQLKLERTQDNLDRALDVEREARLRLRPLKRQAEAAELHARLERQTDEAAWTLAREGARAAREALAAAEASVAAARRAADATEAELREVSARRAKAEEALSARGSSREGLSQRFYAARSAGERIGLRLEGAREAAEELERRAARRRSRLGELQATAEADVADEGAEARIAALNQELAALAEDQQAALERELESLEERRAAAAVQLERLAGEAEAADARRAEVEAAAEAARRERRTLEQAAEAARREAARAGAELAKVNQFLRTQAGAPGGAPALADGLRAEPGYELALAAALGPRLRAAVAADVEEAERLLDRAGKDGGAALVVPAASPAPSQARMEGAEPLLAHVSADGHAAALAPALLAGVWVVEDLESLAEGFDGVAVTREGRVWSAGARELRQVPAGGEDRVLAERNRREQLVGQAEAAAQAEHAALQRVEEHAAAVAEADARRDEAERGARAATRAREEAAEAERHARWLIEQRRRAPQEGPAAERRAQLESALATEKRLADRAERERSERAQQIEREQQRLARDEALRPRALRLAEALDAAGAAVAARVEVLGAELEADRAAGEQLTAELRSCATRESEVHQRLKQRGEEVTRGEVRAQQARDHAEDAEAELTRLAAKLELEAEPAAEPLPEGEREALTGRIERLRRRREQLGPVNPLAQAEYQEALEHVEELESQREDLEGALRELKGLIRDTDKRIQDAFHQTFTAAADNFEDVAEQLFPGGHGRLRLVREEGPRAVIGGGEEEQAPDAEERAESEAEEAEGPDDDLGVEIEITPAGKSTKRLTLLSGGEKSLTALAFLFAVFLARPCPFYILDEVEAALDDLNIDRFLTLLRRFSDRAQFIVVTHQKRTMEAADCLYGVSMAGNGVSRVISRRLPSQQEEAVA
jgi:chromosome segregation protein